MPRDAAFWIAALHSAGEGPVPGRARPNQAVRSRAPLIDFNRRPALIEGELGTTQNDGKG